MKKLVLTLILGSFAVMMIHAQTEEPRKFDKSAFQAKRNAYITAELKLTPDEAAVFIPLDNELKDKMFNIGRDCRRLFRETYQKEAISDELYQKIIDCYLDSRIKEATMEKEYYERFKKILSPEKLFKYQQADEKFMREFLRGFDNNDRNRDGRGQVFGEKNSSAGDNDRNRDGRGPGPDRREEKKK